MIYKEIRALVAGLVPVDAVEEDHRQLALRWLDRTDDLFRRVAPRIPSPHLVSHGWTERGSVAAP